MSARAIEEAMGLDESFSSPGFKAVMGKLVSLRSEADNIVKTLESRIQKTNEMAGKTSSGFDSMAQAGINTYLIQFLEQESARLASVSRQLQRLGEMVKDGKYT